MKKWNQTPEQEAQNYLQEDLKELKELREMKDDDLLRLVKKLGYDYIEEHFYRLSIYTEEELAEIEAMEEEERERRSKIVEGKLSSGHARALIDLEDEDVKYELALRIVEEQLSVRDIERIVKAIKENKTPREKKPLQNSFIYQDLEEKMVAIMGTKVNIKQKAND